MGRGADKRVLYGKPLVPSRRRSSGAVDTFALGAQEYQPGSKPSLYSILADDGAQVHCVPLDQEVDKEQVLAREVRSITAGLLLPDGRTVTAKTIRVEYPEDSTPENLEEDLEANQKAVNEAAQEALNNAARIIVSEGDATLEAARAFLKLKVQNLLSG